MTGRGIALALVVGVLGAAIWGAVAYYTGYEVAMLAWLIGAAIGAAVVNVGDHGPVAGIGAAVITALSLMAGKYFAVEASIQHALAEVGMDVVQADDELCISYLADDVVQRAEEAGKTINWPNPETAESPSEEGDYPPAVWKIAADEWQEMTTDEREEMRDGVEDEMEAGVAMLANMARQGGFFASFSAYDLLFFGLGICTAFGIPNNPEGLDGD